MIGGTSQQNVRGCQPKTSPVALRRLGCSPWMNFPAPWWALLGNIVFNVSFSLLTLRTCRTIFSFMEDQSPGYQGSGSLPREEPVASTSSWEASTIPLPSHRAQLWGQSQVLGGLISSQKGWNKHWHPRTREWTRQLRRKRNKMKGWTKLTSMEVVPIHSPGRRQALIYISSPFSNNCYSKKFLFAVSHLSTTCFFQSSYLLELQGALTVIEERQSILKVKLSLFCLIFLHYFIA